MDCKCILSLLCGMLFYLLTFFSASLFIIWKWKFYLIEQWMDALDEGDILVYLDAGSQINKGGEKRFFEYVNMINGSPYDMLGFQIHPNLSDYKWTTTKLLNAFNVTEHTRPAITHTAQFEANTLVIQKGPHY